MLYTILVRFVLIIIVQVILPSFVLSQSIIKGNIKWNPDWKCKMYLFPLADFEFGIKPIDSIQINRDGSFYHELSGSIKNNLLYRLQIPPRDGNSNSILEGPAENLIQLYLPPRGVTELIADADSFYFSANFLHDTINKRLSLFRDFKRPFRDLILKVERKVSLFPDSAEKFKEEIYEDWLKELTVYKNRIKREIIKSSDPAFILLGLYNYYMANFGRYDSSFFSQTINRIKDQQQTLVKRIREDLKSVSNNRVGMIFPGLLMKDETGLMKSIRAYKAKYIIVDFWASWCSPCRLSIRSHLPQLHKGLEAKNMVLVGISVDENEALWKSALQTDKPGWPQLHDFDQTASCHDYFHIAAYPAFLVLDENYQIIFETSSDFELESYLEKIN